MTRTWVRLPRVRLSTAASVTAAVVLVAVLVSVPHLGGVGHVLFRTAEVEATVVGVEEAGTCAWGSDYDYVFSWDRAGERHTGRKQLCGRRFQAFEDTTIWVDGDEVASTEPPWLAWAAWLLLTVAVAGTVRYVGRRLDRRHTRVS